MNDLDNILDKLIGEIQSLCDDNDVGFEYYKIPEENTVCLKFKKDSMAFSYQITYTDLLFIDNKYIMNIINDELMNFFDIVRRNRDEV
jgi:hypothetical protein